MKINFEFIINNIKFVVLILNMSNSQPASSRKVSLSQAVLAPLDAVFKAQIHAARSFLNMLWQIAYEHIEVDNNGIQKKTTETNKNLPYNFPISFESDDANGKRITTINIPNIAMVPVSPLGVEEATIKFNMSVTDIADHSQMQTSESDNYINNSDDKYNQFKRPWYLVENPVSLRGHVVSNNSTETSIEINIKLSRIPIPSALDKALTVLTQTISTQTNPISTTKPNETI